MKKLVTLCFAFILVFGVALVTQAQMRSGMMTNGTNTVTNPEEVAGQAIWNNLKTGQATCSTLVDKDFDLPGDYFMGVMMGSSHEMMDKTMAQMFGDATNTQIHVAMKTRSTSYPFCSQ